MGLLRYVAAFALVAAAAYASPPNVVLIMTDDQGYGDLGHHGNPVIQTPRLDALARESVQVDPFYVNPVCSPTRAALLTGRYNYRTGVVDTYRGRSMMHPDERTLAEILGDAGYRTGIFGKWHLGDNYPLRPMDQGFDESLVHKGGGITQSSDPPQGSSYFDPYIYRNGVEEQASGYCSDVFTDGAIEFVRRDSDEPFFAYLAYNAPHNPLQISDEYTDPYRGLDMAASDFPDHGGWDISDRFNPEDTARVYGMITNIDDNVGRLLDALDEEGVADSTIVVFMTDNGPQHPRYNAGLRGRKGSVFEGGLRVPFFVRWPGHLQPGLRVSTPGAHIDVTPTILDACGVPAPEKARFDGRSLWPLLAGEAVDWETRPLAFQWHRGNAPEQYRAFAIRQGRYKLLQPGRVQADAGFDATGLMLFDVVVDPFEQNDLAAARPDVVDALKTAYEAWFRDVSSTRGYDAIRIHVGSEHENPVVLTRQDRRVPKDATGWAALGVWEVSFDRDGTYSFLMQFPELDAPSRVTLHVAGRKYTRRVIPGNASVEIGGLALSEGDTAIAGELERDEGTTGVHYITVTREE